MTVEAVNHLHMNNSIQRGLPALVVLKRDAPPEFSSIGEVPASVIEVHGQTFTDSGLGDWLGFYDWLRDSAKKVIGVRIWFDEENAHSAGMAECKNVEVGNPGGTLTIFFGEDHKFEKSLSDDQDFGGNRLFLNATMYALTFNAPQAR